MTKVTTNKLASIAVDGVVRKGFNDLVMANEGTILFKFPLNYTEIPESTSGKVKDFDYNKFYKGLEGMEYTAVEIDIPKIKENYKKAKGMSKAKFDETTNYIKGVFSFKDQQDHTLYVNSKNIIDIVSVIGENIKFKIPESCMRGSLVKITSDDCEVMLFQVFPKAVWAERS